MKSKLSALFAVFVLMSGGLILMLPSEDDAGESFFITDGTGERFYYPGPSEHVVCGGVGAALTVADAGYIEKIVAVDKYSTYSYTKNVKLKNLDAVDFGSMYGTTNHEFIITSLVNMKEEGRISLGDSIILTSYTSNLELRERLNAIGFERVLVWTSEIDTYDTVVDFVKSVSKIVAGTETQSIRDMEDKYQMVKDYVATHTTTNPPKALYVAYSGNALKVGNTGLMHSMLKVCGADQLGYDASKSASYGDSAMIVSILGENRDAVVFVQNAYFASGYTLDTFYNDVLGGDRSIRVIEMGIDWNNWCPESVDAVYEIAEQLYEGKYIPKTDESSQLWIMLGASLALVALIIAVTWFTTKRIN